MNLKIKCKNNHCRELFKYPSNYITRMEIENEKGLYFQKQCPTCLSYNEYHLNDIRAYDNKVKMLFMLVFAIALGAGMMIYLWDSGLVSGLSITIPFAILGIYKQQTDQATLTFNKHRVSQTR